MCDKIVWRQSSLSLLASKHDMKSILLTTIAAVLVVGCATTQSPEPTTTKAPDISILYAAETKNIDAIKQHLTAGTDVNTKDSKGKTPLHHAAYWGHEEIVELLISRGADVNAVIESGGLKGKTPLGLAWRHHPEVTDFLRKHGGKTGAWLNAYNSIHAAARAGHIKAVKQHLASGADVNAKTMSGFTPLDATSVFNKTETADLLRKHGGKTKMELKAEGK